MRSALGAAFALWVTVVLMSRGLDARRLPAPQSPSASAPFPGVLDEHPAIQYALRPTHDRVARLNAAMAAGKLSLAKRPDSGYFRSVLDALDVPVQSQLLVFSKTGIQGDVTGPDNPRALFFNQSVVVGYIAGARYLEIASHDPEQGVVFYTVDQQAAAPTFVRGRSCLSCHVSASTLEVPGLIVRSNHMSADGTVVPQLGNVVVDHRTPLIERWGGWFVTGDYTPQPYGVRVHRGNVTGAGLSDWGPETTSNEVFIRWLNSAPEAKGYPSTDSDIAALLAFDHQSHAINLFTRLNWEVRVAAASGSPDFGAGVLRELVNDTADYLLFVGEAPPPTRITPRAGFAEAFAAGVPRDRAGRSLRDLDLEKRLLRYPCSYMVYSEAFQALPAGARQAVYQRMGSILALREIPVKYAPSAADRRAVVEILRDTLKDLPPDFARGTR